MLYKNVSTEKDSDGNAVLNPVHRGGKPTGNGGRLSDLFTLGKARVNGLVVATTFVGFALHSDILSKWWILLQTLTGTGLVAAGAAVANQVVEFPFDQKMLRTRSRPIAAGRFLPASAGQLSALLLILGCLWLSAAVNFISMSLAALAFVIYVFAYTPLKRLTPVCTLVGAVAGALPVLVGWAATGEAYGQLAAFAFVILFLWQIPHFLAIAWWRRSEYECAGFHVLYRDDHDGRWTAGSAFGIAIVLFAVSLLPAFWHLVSDGYVPLVLIINIAFGCFAIRFLRQRTEAIAHQLFIASVCYLPLLLLLVLLCKNP